MCFLKILLLGAILSTNIYTDAKKYVLTNNRTLNQQINLNGTYNITIKRPFDLQGDTLRLPVGAKIVFKRNGKISNGHVVFNTNSFSHKRNQKAFSGCSFSGNLENEKLCISMFGVTADGKTDDAPIINQVLSVIDGGNCHLFFDCDGDYGISSVKQRSTVMVGSNTEITFTGKGFLKLLRTSKMGAVLSLKDYAHDVVINNIQIDGGGEGVIVGNSGQNGIGARLFNGFRVNGGVIRNCNKGRETKIDGIMTAGDGGKGIQIESADCRNGVFDGIYIVNCHAAISCHRNFDKQGGINVVFSNITGENCEQFAIIHQTNGEDTTGEEQNVLIKNFVSKNCGFVDGVFVFSRTRYLTVENGVVEGDVNVPAIFRGRIAKSVVRNVEISQPCNALIDLNPSTYGLDQRASFGNYFNLDITSSFDYLMYSDVTKRVPYRSMTESLVSAKCNNAPRVAVYSNEVNSSGMLNIKLQLPDNRFFEGQSVMFDKNFGARHERLAGKSSTMPRTEGSTTLHPRGLTIKDKGFTYWNTDSSALEIWDGTKWVYAR